MAFQEIDNSPAASATNIQRTTLMFDKGNGSLVLLNPIVSRERITVPMICELVIALRDFAWGHTRLHELKFN